MLPSKFALLLLKTNCFLSFRLPAQISLARMSGLPQIAVNKPRQKSRSNKNQAVMLKIELFTACMDALALKRLPFALNERLRLATLLLSAKKNRTSWERRYKYILEVNECCYDDERRSPAPDQLLIMCVVYFTPVVRITTGGRRNGRAWCDSTPTVQKYCGKLKETGKSSVVVLSWNGFWARVDNNIHVLWERVCFFDFILALAGNKDMLRWQVTLIISDMESFEWFTLQQRQ